MSTKKIKKRPRRQIPNLCRICLTGSASMVDLTHFLNNDQNIGLHEALEKVMCCKVVLSSDIPDHICSMCLSLLRISYNLKIQFEETQKKIFSKYEEEPLNLKYDPQVKKEKLKSEVELIVGDENYNLGDILIVEEEEKNENYTQFLKNLGKAVTVEYCDRKSEDTNEKKTICSPVNIPSDVEIVEKEPSDEVLTNSEIEEYETIVIQTVSDDDEDTSFHWEHEYAKNTTSNNFKPLETKRRGGRKSKYPQSILDKINSLIIEGNVKSSSEPNGEDKKEDECTEEVVEEESTKHEKPKKRNRWSNAQLQEIEKYIIYGSEAENELKIHKPSLSDTEALKEGMENAIQLDVFRLDNENAGASIELDSTILTDELVLDAWNGKNVCQQCSMTFATRIGLKRHLMYVHKRRYPPARRPKGEKLSREAKIRRRIESIKRKLDNNPMLCQVCGYVSKSSGGAKYHSLTHGEKLYPCNQCPKKFYTPSHLKNHREYKHEAKRSTHLCPLCGEYRNSATALAYHLKKHTHDQRKYPCHICGIKFIVKSALNNHLRRHNGDRRFPCQICDKSFFTTNELKKHFMIHTGERPFQCNYCDKRFVTPYNQKVHMMTHDGPFLCEYCHKGFVDVDMLTLHLRHKHRISVPKNENASESEQEENSNEAQILEGLNLLPPEEDNLDFEGD